MNRLIFFPGRRRRTENDCSLNLLNVRCVPTNLIMPNPFQARKNYDGESIILLAESIKRYGIIQPLGVRRYTAGKFELVFGERRLRAARLIDLQEVPCIIIDNIGHRTACELAFAENTHRESFDIDEKARCVEILMRKFGAERNDVCRNLSIYREEMDFLLEILRLSAPEREAICNSTLTYAHLKHILKINNCHVRMHLINVIEKNGVPASVCEAFIGEYLGLSSKKCETSKTVKPRATRHLVLGDIRVFINSIDHAVELVRSSGAEVICEKNADSDNVTYTINVSRGKKH